VTAEDSDKSHYRALRQIEVAAIVKKLEFREARSARVWDIDVAQLQQGPMILEQQGKPVAVVIGIEDYR